MHSSLGFVVGGPTPGSNSAIARNADAGLCQTVERARIAVASGLAAAAIAAVVTVGPVDAATAGLVNGRLRECKADQNCISTTSIRNATKFGAPWTYLPQTSDRELAWTSLIDAVASQPKAKIVESTDTYIHAEFPGFPKGIDDVEFSQLDEGLVGYRSCSREITYVYPITQPIGDFGTNRARLTAIRSSLGWEELGADADYE